MNDNKELLKVEALKLSILEITERLGENERVNNAVIKQLKEECNIYRESIKFFCKGSCGRGWEKLKCYECPLDLSLINRG